MYEEESKLEEALQALGLDPVDRGRYYYIKCPFHEDNHKSAQCFKDGWIRCHAGCPARHINSVSHSNVVPRGTVANQTVQEQGPKDFTDLWLSLEPLTENVKGVDFTLLNRLGWRKFEGRPGVDRGIFIPYFNVERSKVRFWQIRHEEGSDRRFTFARGCRPIVYGLDTLHHVERYLVFTEGARDSAILRGVGVPAVALPSASSGAQLNRMEQYATDHGLVLVCCGDRDEAGDRLISNIKGPYIDARTPVGKDVGDLFEQRGMEGVRREYAKYIVNWEEPV